jgi:uncharacterized protein YjiS (DUF1127 family)
MSSLYLISKTKGHPMRAQTFIATSPRLSQKRRTGVTSWFLSILDAQRSRTALSKLDQRLLDDVGLTPKDIQSDLDTPVWDVPNHWSR